MINHQHAWCIKDKLELFYPCQLYRRIRESQAGGELPPIRFGNVLLDLEPLLQTLPLEVGEHSPGPGLLSLPANSGMRMAQALAGEKKTGPL